MRYSTQQDVLAMDTRRDRTEIAQEILDSYEDVGV